MSRVLVVDDDPAVLSLLKSVLDLGGFAHEAVATAGEARAAFAAGGFDAVLLDLSLPDLDGSELITLIRERSDLPILIISGQHEEPRRVATLDLGADDFIPKPFLPGELLARLRAAIRRAGPRPADRGIAFEPDQPFIDVRGRRVPLSSLERKMLSVLAQSPDGIATKEALCEGLWGAYSAKRGKTLYVMANRLRNKIEADPAHPIHLVSQHGVGYRLRLQPLPDGA